MMSCLCLNFHIIVTVGVIPLLSSIDLVQKYTKNIVLCFCDMEYRKLLCAFGMEY